jgi:hypothetical protein
MRMSIEPYQNRKPPRCKADLWRVQNRLTLAEMAAGAKVSQPELTRCFHPVEHPKWRKASLRIRERIRDFTGGEVGLYDWPERPAGNLNPPLPEPTGGHCPSARSSRADGTFSDMKGAA